MILQIASVISGVGFLVYGYQCLFSQFMESEFVRFKVPHYRTLTGILEILGGIGVLAGLSVPVLGIAAASGLALLMALGVATRIRVGDGFVQYSPALFFCILNGMIAVLHASGI
ncbi:MAG: hypothetical protein EBX52_08415 [Proteobacteria bacterium]|nr:hypothetical protein [Pseudomonadota bacterium]